MSALAQRSRRGVAFQELNGRQKAAILLMAAGPERAAVITSGLGQTEIEEISLEIARLEHVSSDVVDQVLDEWEQTERAAVSLAEGGFEYAKQVLEKALGPQKAAGVLKRIEAQLREAPGFTNLRNGDPQQVSSLIRNEHPQTIALVLSHLDAPQTAAVLKELPGAVGSGVLYRMAKMEKVLPEVLQVVERCFGSDSEVGLRQEMASSGGPSAVAAVLNLLTGSQEKELLDGIATQDQELCDQIKNLMFVFEDIIKLDDRALQRILKDVETKELALALKAASESLKQRILGTMSQRAMNALKEEMEFLGPVRVRDVEAAQSNIVKLIRALEETGDIVIGGGKDDLLL